ncbi:MAG TPA: serine/threonine-protein kinase, partial [Kofleriaceae bacterium]|nr:serine/threonine-protein kinase [Kofleriaceae bacterium]
EDASVGPYRVVRKIGEGGMGAVYLGEHTLIGRRAAIKVLLPELSSKRESVDRFFNEARATIAIPDPGIVQVFDFGFTAENVAYIVMELLEGEQLNIRLSRLGTLSPVDALRITRQAAGSLGAAHAAGIVHRDLKPENLYMVRDPEAPGGERVKILDFGIAKLSDEVLDRVRTRTGAVLGTPVYMSPEQCHGADKVDYRADIYSLGCVLFHLLTGRPPFDMPGMGAVISAHLREQPPAPSSLVPQLPPGIDEIVLCCLEKAPEARFATMLELQQACDTVLARITGGGALLAPRLSGAFSVPMLRPITMPETDPRGTTLGTAAGQPVTAVPTRRKLGRWIAVAALAGGVGATIALLTGRSGAHDLPRSSGSAPTDIATVPAPTDPPSSGPAAVAPAPPPPAPANQTTVPAAPVDAGAGDAAAPDAAPRAEPSSRPAVPAVTPRPSPPPQPARPRPRPTPTPTPNNNDDLYDDRN